LAIETIYTRFMGKTRIAFLGVAGLFLWLAGCASAPTANPWREAIRPAPADPVTGAQAIGGYAGGCVRGARSLFANGPGYEVMNLTRGRFYGHPVLIAFIERFGREVEKKHLGALLIGDLAQPRGGPTMSSHKSHQSGLDVDIWYRLAPLEEEKGKRKSWRARVLSLEERQTLESPSVLNSDRQSINYGIFGPGQARIVEMAARDPDVERIFVTPAVKLLFCTTAKGDRSWLAKIRPWWGHDDHFHVRLKCPAGQALCKTQEALPAGDGCDPTLDWWFSDEARQKAKEVEKEGPSPMPQLPPECAAVLKL
jgi:penicillin-insensitive murein endopeptidase